MTDEYLVESSMRLEEKQLEWNINKVKSQAKRNEVSPIGKCHDCGEKFDESDPQKAEKKFCDDVCESSWREWREAQIRRHGPSFQVPVLI